MKNLFCEKKNLNNEDSVEKLFLDRLIKKLNFKDRDIKTKQSIQQLTISKGRKKENYKPDYVLYKNKKPIIIIEAKATNEDVDDFIYQGAGYSLSLNSTYKNENPIKYFVLSNGIITKIFKWDEDKPILSLKFEDFSAKSPNYKELLNMLSFETIIEDKISSEFKFEKVSTKEIDGIFRACHNLIWKKETINPTDAFYEFCKLFFIKLKQDKDLHLNYINKGEFPPIDEFKFSEQWIKKQGAVNPVNSILFKEELLPFLKKERDDKGKKRIFEENENINLQSATIKEVVKLLEHVDFYNIDEDLNGRMFETFLSSTVRGKDLGQFFTPRTVVKFMVKMANIEVKKDKIDKVFDGCSGSGGFLIDAMADMVIKIDKMRNLTNKEKEKLKEKIYLGHIYGSEKSLKNSRVTRMNLWFHGDGSSNVYCLDTLDKNFKYDKSLSDERKKEIEELKEMILNENLKFDIIFTNPPFSTKYEWSKKDEREILDEYDISYKELDKEKDKRVSSLKSNVMFIERYCDLLEKGGKLLTVIDESVLNADQEKYFRKYILNNFIVKAVISLPKNTFTNADTGTKTSILYLRKKMSEDEEQPPIFMAISENIGHSDSGRPEPEKNDLFRIKDETGEIVNKGLKTTILEEFEKWENGY
jgi:type I restriction enzyme M protein